ncbi:MAG: hypothetical protein WC371_00285 [Parachlamydiales bacterium]|jgi:hypothetical protein
MASKKSFTLLELLAALVLASLLLSLLLSFTFQLFGLERNIKITKELFFQRAALEIRLGQLLGALSPPLKDQPRTLYTKDSHLFFYFQGGVDPNPFFSGKLLGELFLSKRGELVLITRSLKQKTLCRQELLWEDATGLEFVFFQKNASGNPQKPPFKKTRLWQKNGYPDALKIKITPKTAFKNPDRKAGPAKTEKIRPLKYIFFFEPFALTLNNGEEK